jgi:hypothetical protein
MLALVSIAVVLVNAGKASNVVVLANASVNESCFTFSMLWTVRENAIVLASKSSKHPAQSKAKHVL